MRTAYIVVGLGWGDEGKGATVDALTRHYQADLIVRYNGGAQCAHNVVTADGRHHTFSQFGSGMFVDGVHTHLSRFVLINPIAMMEEAKHLVSIGVDRPFERTTVEWDAFVITPFQKELNRALEIIRGDNRHGSCGQGIGVTREQSLLYPDEVVRMKDLSNFNIAREKLNFVQQLCLQKAIESGWSEDKLRAQKLDTLLDADAVEWTLQQYEPCPLQMISPKDSMELIRYNQESVIFEGAQGVLLDETKGFLAPHVTWTNTTSDNAHRLLRESIWNGVVREIGCIRTYHTRHGAGPFPTEYERMKWFIKEPHNCQNDFQGAFRFGLFDRELFQYALRTNPVGSLAVSHLDQCLETPKNFIEYIEQIADVPIEIEGYGPTYEDRQFHGVPIRR